MEKNIGPADRIIRFIIGLIALYLLQYSYWWLVLAVPALVTASTGFCWPYKLFGINTNKQPVLEKVQVKANKKKL